MTDRASFHTGNALEQFLHRNKTLILLHTVLEQLWNGAKTYPVQCEHSPSGFLKPGFHIVLTQEV